MSNLLDGLYLCSLTGQNVEVLEGKVNCSVTNKYGDCKKAQPNEQGCSVFTDANHAYIQSQPKVLHPLVRQAIIRDLTSEYPIKDSPTGGSRIDGVW